MTTKPSTDQDDNDSDLIKEDGFTIADVHGDAKAVLGHLRTRLLDLTLLNKLLNFRHGARTVRVIDELPDELFARLMNGDELEFVPVPEPPPGHPARAAIRPEADAGKAVPGTRPARTKQKEREGAARTYAKELGLATDFELPTPLAGARQHARHTDAAIQTLLFPSDLERVLRAILSDARSAIQEKGSNILHLVFGFLEWFESESSTKAILSPLVTLPVALRRGDPNRKTGAYRFFISYSGDDVLPNISLQEKLRQDFKIEIPDIGEEDTPETYLRRIVEEVPLFPRWSVRRHISLGLLVFTKLLMYRDLDPKKWPDERSPTKHPLLLELFRGSSGESKEYASEYDLDVETELGSTPVVPPVILDADSSQHSAIVDAMAGRSMVIEGPPGTGKSQTIANLIAAALANDKTVLFVADKLTALEVVRKRLDNEGLGVFCLELHSDKTQKTRLMDDLRERLELRHTFRTPEDLKGRLSVLRDSRRTLNEYAKSVNARFGSLGWSIHDILWGTQRRRTDLGSEAERWSGVLLPDAQSLTLPQYEDIRRAAETFASAVRGIRGRATLREHPFWGAWPEPSTPDLETKIARALATLQDAVSRATVTIRGAATELDSPVPNTYEGLAGWASAARGLASAAPGACIEVGVRLGQGEARDQVGDWCAAVEGYGEHVARFSAAARGPHAREVLRALPHGVFETLSGDAPLHHVNALGRGPEVATRLDRAGAVCARLGALLGAQRLPLTLPALQMALEVVELAASAPVDLLPFRPHGDDSVAPTLDWAVNSAEQLRSERAQLGELFDLGSLPEPAVLDKHAGTCFEAGWFRFLSGAYREAKAQYLLLARTPGSVTAAQMAAGYKALSSHVRRLAAFESRADVRSILGAAYQGIDTNFVAVREAQRWQSAVRALQRRHAALTPHLAAFASADIGCVHDVAAVGDELRAIAASELPGLVRDLLSWVPADRKERGWTNAPLAEVATALRAAARAVASLAAAIATVQPAVGTVGELASLTQMAHDLAAYEQSLNTPSEATAVLGPLFMGTESATESVRATVGFASALFAPTFPARLRNYLCVHPSPQRLQRLVALLDECLATLSAVYAAEKELVRAACITRSHWYGTETPPSFSDIAGGTARAFEHRTFLASWLTYLRARSSIYQVGLGDVLVEAEANDLFDAKRIPDIADLIVYQSLAHALFDVHPGLRGHDGLAHTLIQSRFQKYDVECMRLQRQMLACRVDSRPSPEGIRQGSVKNFTDMALLRHELGKQKRHIPIRQLVARAGEALRAMKPCFMMSPRSVAQYLAPYHQTFDLVVMDEASQLRPEDAVGAIARARQAVIVGDSKQLPPTSFFAATADDDGESEEEYITENKESILDLARMAFRPARQLKWHYRSRHGSLIAFSNARYYDNSLIVFPGPRERSDGLGVQLVHVKDASYAAGLNMREAEVATDAVVEHLRTRPDETFGVVALNVRQKSLLEGLIDARLKDEPELRRRFDRAGATDGAFIKNLESVQGDERDVIFISVTYGPSSPGARVARRFGPLNGTNGWRRLNVLFTRARLRVVVFASFMPEELGDDEKLSRGARDLRDYLTFARTGIYQHASVTDRDPDSDFEVEVAESLRNAGYAVTPQVGVAGYFVDMGVRSTRRPGDYVLGVECDGATYHSSFSARDRDRLRQSVLEGLGWKLHRIWSTDWFRDPRAEVQRLIEAVKAAEAADGA